MVNLHEHNHMSSVPLTQQLKSRRTAFGWSQQKLAEEAKLSIDTIRGIEQGHNNNPTLYVIKAIQKAMDFMFEL